ncbi:hypothetical protein BS50DRAFT_326614 [Corynespora cassiicola Philippines]|uniref:Uncharacterized protein n=1 Tax=Corynespora cassiicola Philippines TaxID=1448308 RepID=A0A2T2NTW4_CORCC|nr:hypothetical protein BS50DRAFT_326614 [Corynespora cassiicola Philippines]
MIKLFLQKGVSGNPVHIPGSTIGWSPASIAIFHGQKSKLERLSQPYKDLLKLEEVDPQICVGIFKDLECSGCYDRINGTIFRCHTCRFIYCFMCKPFLPHLHENHEREEFE